MTIFAVIAPSEEPKLEAAVAREFKENFYKVGPGQFLISAEKETTTKISERLGTKSGAVGKVLVMRVSNYTGWHARDLWEWIAVRMGAPPIEQPLERGDENGSSS